MLSKYTIAFLVPSMLGYLLVSRRDRRWLATPWPYLAGVVSLVVFLPVIYWNWQHDWASFRFQGPARFRNARGFSLLDGLCSAAELWLFILPVTVPLALATLWGLIRVRQPREQFLLWSFFPMALFFLVMGATPSFHLLWPLPAYLGLTVAMAGTLTEPGDLISRMYAARPGWLVGIVSAAVIGAAVYSAQLVPYLPAIEGPYGWETVAERTRAEAARMPPNSFILGVSSRSYLCPSQLAFYLRMPGLVEGNNVIGLEGLQYRYWADPGRLAGRDALVVAEGGLRNAIPFLLRVWFESVERVGEVVVPGGSGRKPLRCCLYHAHNYHPVPCAPLANWSWPNESECEEQEEPPDAQPHARHPGTRSRSSDSHPN